MGSNSLLWCREYELLLRALFALPNKPQVVLFMTLLPTAGLRPQPWLMSSELGISQVANYYLVPMISMRNALWRLQQANVTGFDDNTTRWHSQYAHLKEQSLWHFNKLGNKHMADLAMHWFESMQAAPEVTDLVAESGNVPYALMPNNTRVPETLMCAYNKNMPEHADLTYVQAADNPWKWERDHKNKYGFVTHTPNVTLNITWTSPVVPAQYDPTSLYLAWVGYLFSSYRGMGTAEFSCEGGCACVPGAVNAFSSQPMGIIHFAMLTLTDLRGSCTVVLRALPHSRPNTTEEYTFKVNGLIITKCNNGEFCTQFPATLHADT